MWAVFGAVAHIIDWRFAAGLVVGLAIALKYIICVYHPLLRALLDAQDE